MKTMLQFIIGPMKMIWLKREMKNKQLSAQVLVKIKGYLNGLERDKER